MGSSESVLEPQPSLSQAPSTDPPAWAGGSDTFATCAPTPSLPVVAPASLGGVQTAPTAQAVPGNVHRHRDTAATPPRATLAALVGHRFSTQEQRVSAEGREAWQLHSSNFGSQLPQAPCQPSGGPTAPQTKRVLAQGVADDCEAASPFKLPVTGRQRGHISSREQHQAASPFLQGLPKEVADSVDPTPSAAASGPAGSCTEDHAYWSAIPLRVLASVAKAMVRKQQRRKRKRSGGGGLSSPEPAVPHQGCSVANRSGATAELRGSLGPGAGGGSGLGSGRQVDLSHEGGQLLSVEAHAAYVVKVLHGGSTGDRSTLLPHPGSSSPTVGCADSLQCDRHHVPAGVSPHNCAVA
ncbi:hypothetical protein V8C86DRAFT_2726128 [Haematococcus lacustris]